MERSTQRESTFAAEWLNKIFGDKVIPAPAKIARISAEKQGYLLCARRRSLESREITIGSRAFTRGLATHAESEISVQLPSPGAVFSAKIGRDQNRNVKTEKANIAFVVESGGKELYRSASFVGGEEALPIEVPLGRSTEFTLRVTGQWDMGHGDWADAEVTLQNGERLFLDDIPFSGFRPDGGRLPFSFVYDGAPSESFLDKWDLKTICRETADGKKECNLIFTDPVTRLAVTFSTDILLNFAGAEWKLNFQNLGDADTPIIENIQALDIPASYHAAEGALILHTAKGSEDSACDFEGEMQKLSAGETVKISCKGGRSSSGTMPYFGIESAGIGMLFGIGWTGQWTATFERDAATGLTVRAGMERTHMTLHPGEKMRTPAVTALFFEGGTEHAHNVWRQMVLKYYSPMQNGRPAQAPITWQTWGMQPVEQHISNIRALSARNVPYDYYWIDAGWYGDCKVLDDWKPQAGNWNINSKLYPDGMKPISNLLHEHGKGFLLWLDPERVCRGTSLFTEHPDWILTIDGEESNLLDLGNEAARRYITDLILNFIENEGVDAYRQDFNIDPLPFWEAADAEEPNRVGMTEIRHIEGLYAFWDELLTKHPGLLIDNCSSGGRRLDLEMTRRSIPLWRSDLQCGPNYSAAGSQSQTFALAQWLPLNTAGCHVQEDDYDFRSAISSASVTAFYGDLSKEDSLLDWVAERFAETRSLRKYFLGDFHPLTDYSLSEGVWMAYQLDRDDLGEGAILAYRRESAPYTTAKLKLKGLDADSSYILRDLQTGKETAHAGRALMKEGLEMHISQAPDSAFFVYSKDCEK